MQVSSVLSGSERVERSAPTPSPPKGGRGVGVLTPVKPGRGEAAEWVRSNLPVCSEVADAFRSEFPDVRMTLAKEKGRTLGSQFVGPMMVVSGDDLVPNRKAAK